MNSKFEESLKQRQPTYNINSLFLKRWSPRSFKNMPIKEQDLLTLFEAARWAPSSFNNQPWRFIYAQKNTKNWDTFFSLLTEGNKEWAKNAAALIIIASFKKFDKTGKPSRTHSFDTGAAWMSLALEAAERGLVAHGMEGFDYEQAKKACEISSDYQVEAMAAIGYPDSLNNLSKKLRKLEKPSERKPLTDFVFEGKLNKFSIPDNEANYDIDGVSIFNEGVTVGGADFK